MQAGKLDKRLAFQRPVEASDGQGGTTVTWTAIATVWGSLAIATGFEREQAAQMVAVSTWDWRIWWSSQVNAVTPKDRFTWNSRTFQVVTVTNTGSRGREITGTAIEVTA